MCGPIPPAMPSRLLQEHGDDAKLLAGGHSLIPLMKYRLASPAVIIDIGRLSDSATSRKTGPTCASAR